MFGWRARIGFISPAPGGPPTSLLEMQSAAPDGVVFLAPDAQVDDRFTKDVFEAIAAHRHYDRPVDGIAA